MNKLNFLKKIRIIFHKNLIVSGLCSRSDEQENSFLSLVLLDRLFFIMITDKSFFHLWNQNLKKKSTIFLQKLFNEKNKSTNFVRFWFKRLERISVF